MVSERLQKKIDRAIKLLQSIPVKEGEQIEVAYSGGKDSDVILQLTKEAGIPYRAIYKNTTIDPPGTIRHVKEMGVEVMQPKKSFFQLVSERGFPTRMVRFCCQELKEYKVCDKNIQGVRRDESLARKERYKEPEMCRTYANGDKARSYFPILDWTNEDVAAYLKDRGIKCAPVYYDEQGNFHPERRLGCMGCPMSSNQLKEFKANPKLVKAWLRAGQKRYETASPETALRRNYKNAYEVFVQNVFFSSQNEFIESIRGGLFDDGIDCKAFLEDYFNITL